MSKEKLQRDRLGLLVKRLPVILNVVNFHNFIVKIVIENSFCKWLQVLLILT